LSTFKLTGKKKVFILQEETRVVEAIRAAEKRTSGEVRVYIESKCRYVNPVDRAAEVFFSLQMERTKDRNAVLVYVAYKHRQAAIFGDEEIHRRVGSGFWEAEIAKMLRHFSEEEFSDGLVAVIHDIGEVLSKEFPFERDDKNELPDDIVFGD
jgi:uncharacterized membrane protein